MNIVGLDSLVFGVDDIEACCQYLTDYGLKAVDVTADGGFFRSTDGTGILVRGRDDESLPPALATGSMLRKTVYGVADQAVLDQIAAELGKDREVITLDDGSLEVNDDMGFTLGFQITIREPLENGGEQVNGAGAATTAARDVNALGFDCDNVPEPRSLSHVVYFVPDQAKAKAFYTDRLGFYVVDTFEHVGSFMRPAGTNDHHCLFMINTPPHMQGCEHFTFHMDGPTAVMQAGTNFKNKGYESFWGPGRHIFGSNWFWYFNSPFGCHVEYDADMDLHDESWEARVAPISADNSQLFLFQPRDKWMPGA